MRVPPPDPEASLPAPSTSFRAETPGTSLAQLAPDEQARLAQAVMRRQGALSVRVAMVFVVLLLGLPLVNLYAPGLAGTQILGFSASWLFLGVLFYPITVLLSVYFVRHSDRLEAEATQAFSVHASRAVSQEDKGL